MSTAETATDARLHVVCPSCGSINRVPAARLAEHPKCGNCGQPLFGGRPIELTAANFDVHVNRNDIPVVVDFWAPLCGPCKMMAPAYEQAAGQLEPHYRLAKVNSEAEPALAGRYAIRAIPTLVLFKGGREAARQSGAMGAADIARWVRAHS